MSQKRSLIKDMKSLEEILQQYFDCQTPFCEDGELTNAGIKAYQSLENLIHNLEMLGCFTPMETNRCMRVLDEIIDEKP